MKLQIGLERIRARNGNLRVVFFRVSSSKNSIKNRGGWAKNKSLIADTIKIHNTVSGVILWLLYHGSIKIRTSGTHT